MISRNSWTERHGAFFPPTPLLVRQEPGGNQRERLMMVPTLPRANLVLRQARFALGPPKRFFDAVFGIEDTSEFSQRRIKGRKRLKITL